VFNHAFGLKQSPDTLEYSTRKCHVQIQTVQYKVSLADEIVTMTQYNSN